MYSDPGLTTRTLTARGPSWAGEFPVDVQQVTLDATLCLAAFTDGVVPSGTVLGQVTATGRYAPYGGTTDEVQTVTVGGSGLTSFTLTFSGQTTASIDDAATAADVQAALEDLSNIGEGNVLVTGSAGGPWTVRFVGDLLDTNVAQMTSTPTGGTGTVTVATTTAGGADGASNGTEVAQGHLLQDRFIRTGHNVDAALYYKGRVFEDALPATSRLDANAKADLADRIRYVRLGA